MDNIFNMHIILMITICIMPKVNNSGMFILRVTIKLMANKNKLQAKNPLSFESCKVTIL